MCVMVREVGRMDLRIEGFYLSQVDREKGKEKERGKIERRG